MKHIGFTTLLGLLMSIFSFATSSGPNNPSSSGTDNSIGNITWNNITRIYASDGSEASSNNMSNGDKTYYITASNFGFNIPSTSTIDGIVVEIERDDNAGIGGIKDNSIKIIKGGIISGTEMSVNGAWPNNPTYKTYGGAANLWGLAWTYSDINSSSFGIAVSAKRTTGGASNDAYVDNIRITVYYTSTLPIELLSFQGHNENNSNVISWTTATETNNNYFELERSEDGQNFVQIDRIKGSGNSTDIIEYTTTDYFPAQGINYYRLKQVDFDGQFKYFQTIAIKYAVNSAFDFEVYPNPTDGTLNIKVTNFDIDKEIFINIVNAEGKVVYTKQCFMNEKSLDLLILPRYFTPGTYNVRISKGDDITKDKYFIVY